MQSTPAFSDDLPKSNPWEEDRFDVAPLAKRLARVIYTLHAPNGYVIGLHGQWGSGKSTLLNFVSAYLRKQNEGAASPIEEIRIIDFRPWTVSGHNDLIAAFFKVLAENFGPREGRCRRMFRKVAAWLRGSTDNLIDAAATVAVVVDPSAGFASKLASNLAKRPMSNLIDRFLEEPSLQAAYEMLRKQLAESDIRFLITIDDIDRLEADEVRSIMQLVKTVGRLPNVIYFLSYDREKVSDALDTHHTDSGPRFAEKIVQQEIDLPKPSRHALLTVLDEEISFLTGNVRDSERWLTIVQDGVHRWISSPRDVLRLSNAVKFSWPALEGEIDPQDMLAMEGIRLFDPDAFNWIRENRDFLMGEGRYRFATDEDRQAVVSELTTILPERNRQKTINLIVVLFPRIAKLVYDKKHFNRTEPYHSTVTRRGVATQAGYEAYFSLIPSADAIPKRVIDQIVANNTSEEALTALLRSFVGRRNRQGESMIGNLIEEVRFRFDERERPTVTQGLMNAFFNVGEAILADRPNSDFVLQPSAQLSFLIRDMLQEAEAQHAGELLREAFAQCSSAAFCAQIYVARGRELGVFKAESTAPVVIDRATFDSLGQLILPMIERAAKDGTLRRAPHFWDIVRSWQYLADSGVPKHWLYDGMINDSEFTAKVALGLVGRSHSSQGTSYVFDSKPDEELYDLEAVRSAAQKHLGAGKLSDDQTELLKVVAKGLDKRVSNDSEDNRE